MVQGTCCPPRTMLAYSSVTASDSVYFVDILVDEVF